ncbi:AMIN domain-containing protein [Cohnella endophytica]|uniref:AMIN domain-containing protein n=1 Tax=Cohnella endophytica TaxID=2419778 RepID=A0A494Y2M4_9BACL|nr:N-acetylmuramoyl-L-alanine amidase [Cohnella endophytica]RKP56997.1 AMIN domain-containing protein [Cohnella endophytica]
MKKWLVLLFVVFGMLFLSAGVVSAAKAETLVPQLILDGKTLQPPVPPTVVGQSVMIPARIAIENLGYKVDYDNKKKQVTVTSGSKKLIMTIGQQTAYLDNVSLKMDVAPILVSDKTNQYTFIPLRFLTQSYGVDIYWDNVAKAAFLYTSGSNAGNNGNTGGNTGNAGGSDTQPPDGGLIGVVDPNEPEGGNTDPGAVTPPVITGNLHGVRYEAETNAIILNYDGLIVPTITTLENPKRLVFDFPNGQYAGDFVPTVDFAKGLLGRIDVIGHPALTAVRFSLFGESAQTKIPRLVLDLNQAWDYEVVNDPSIGEFRINLKQPTPDKSKFTVVLDAGHGGSDPGAISITKRPEKEFNLSVILKVQAILALDDRIKIVMTRTSDTFPSLADRYNLANSVNADLFLSVHANSYTAATNGTETYYTREDSKAFANLMHSVFAPATGLKDNGVRQKSLAVTRETKMPAILLEVGYLSSKIDEPQLWTDALQNRVAEAIAKGIKMQLKLY